MARTVAVDPDSWEASLMPGAIFISYSKADVKWKDRLRRFLEPLHVWNDTTCLGG